MIADDRRQRDARRHDAGDPDGVAHEQVEEVRLRGVERPAEKAHLEKPGEHQESQRGLTPPEEDAGSGVVRDFGRQPPNRNTTWREADVVHHEERDREDGREQDRTHEVRDAQVDLPEQPSTDGPGQHRGSRHLRAAREDAVEHTSIPRRAQGVDEPGLHRARVEREAERHQDRRERKRDDTGVDLGQADIEERRHGEHRHAREERDTPAESVCDHARRDLEEDRPQGVSRIGDEHLEEAETRVEQEERVDAPDGGRRQRVQPGQRVVAEDRAATTGSRCPYGDVHSPASLCTALRDLPL